MFEYTEQNCSKCRFQQKEEPHFEVGNLLYHLYFIFLLYKEEHKHREVVVLKQL